MSQVNATNSLSQIMADIDLGPTGSVQFMFAKLQLAQSQICKNEAESYMKQIEDIQQEQKECAEMIELARKGKEVERKARHVAVLDYEITRIDLAAAEVDFRVHCTKGFYVRTYAHDIGQYLGCGAHLTALRRIRSGKFDIAEAVDVPTLKAAGREELLARLLPVEKVLADRA